MHDQNIISFHDTEKSPDLTRRTTSVIISAPYGKMPALTMVGRVKATRHVTICHADAQDGSEVPVGLLYAEVDNAGATYAAMGGMYVLGSFDPAEVTLGRKWTFAAAAAALAPLGIRLEATRPAHYAHSVTGPTIRIS